MSRRSSLLAALAALLAGCSGTQMDVRSGDGSWRLLATAPLTPRAGHSAVWTGRELIVWGGGIIDARAGRHDQRRDVGYSYDPETGKKTPLVAESYADGASYDPLRDRWRKLPPAPVDGRSGQAAVWTGSEMIVFGGNDFFRDLNDGAAFDPRTRVWRRIARAPFRRSPAFTAVWTGRELLIWGGMDHRPKLPTAGAAYDPRTDSWRRIARSTLRPRQWHTGVWTGRELIVWGGTDLVRPDFGDGAAYVTATDTWRRLPRAPIPGRHWHGAVWTGREMIVWGGKVGPIEANDGAAYDPRRRRWRTLASAPLAGRHWPTLVSADEQLFVWGGYDDRTTRVFGTARATGRATNGVAFRLPRSADAADTPRRGRIASSSCGAAPKPAERTGTSARTAPCIGLSAAR